MHCSAACYSKYIRNTIINQKISNIICYFYFHNLLFWYSFYNLYCLTASLITWAM